MAKYIVTISDELSIFQILGLNRTLTDYTMLHQWQPNSFVERCFTGYTALAIEK